MTIQLKISTLILLLITIMVACEKDVSLDIPAGEEKIVVEGSIEQDSPPFIILSKNRPYFASTKLSDIENLLVHNAVVKVSDGTNTVTLPELCTNSLPDSMLQLVSDFTGIDPVDLKNLNYCFYTTFDQSIWGEIGKTYNLIVEAEGKVLTATTKIPKLVSLDSVWFKLHPPHDSLGFAWAHLTDPDTLGNTYRWFATRLNKDDKFIAPYGSVFNDKFINGKSFDFAYDRGKDNLNNEEDDSEDGFYKIGDTIVVKFCSIDQDHFKFWRSLETQTITNGDPFASPAPIQTNITGGLGIWGGYGVTYDTIIAR